jgi:predicted ATPase
MGSCKARILKSVKLIKGFRCFKAGETFEFHPGINLIVGDQGSGKSSLLTLVSGGEWNSKEITNHRELDLVHEKGTPFRAFDFERQNPRIQSHFGETSPLVFLYGNSHSHGETIQKVMGSIFEATKIKLWLLDEPDAALSIRSCYALAKQLQQLAKSAQVLAAVHNPIVIGAFTEVLSLEHRRWMPSTEFIESQKMRKGEEVDKKRPGIDPGA